MVNNRKADITNILRDTNAHDTPKLTKKQSQNPSIIHSCLTRWFTRWQNRRKFYQTISEDEKRWIKQNDVKPEEQLLGIGIPQWMRWTLFISGATMGIVSAETPPAWATVGLLGHEIAELRNLLGVQGATIEWLQSEKEQQDETTRTHREEIALLKESVAKQSAEISRLMKANEELQAQVKYLFAVVNKQDIEISALRRVGFSIARPVKFLLVKRTKAKRLIK
ncbi:hypothetical protein MP638_005057 [Amoeboaphelidium occidentale]|nr:hypothetical protein MP638_005057 [Amoeboaphelidium occidentale]